MEWRGDHRHLARSERLRKLDLDDIDMFRMVFCFCGDASYFKIEPVDIAALFLFRKIKFRIAMAQLLFGERGAIVLVGIGPEVEPDEAQGIGAVVGVGDALKAVERFFLLYSVLHRSHGLPAAASTWSVPVRTGQWIKGI